MKIYNGTTHEINLFTIEQCEASDPRKLIVKEGETPIYTIAAGINLNVDKTNAPTPKLEVPFPVKGAVKFVSYDPLPPGYDIYIVSNLYRSAVIELKGDTSKLATIDGTVYKDPNNLRPCGCLALAIG